jgi:hypothetical protein
MKLKRPPVSIEQKIEIAKYPIIAVPFFGTAIPFQVRMLTETQIQSCGNITLIASFENRIKEQNGKFTRKEMVAYAERNSKILQECLVVPTYEELLKYLNIKEKVELIKKQIEDLQKTIDECPRGPKKQSYEEELDGLRIWYDLIIPTATSSFIVAFVLGINGSDIRKVNRTMLLNAAILAVRGHDNPSDHCEGNFTPFMRTDFNAQAWIVYDEEKELMNAG